MVIRATARTGKYQAASDVSMAGGAATVDALIANGVDTIFGWRGTQLYSLFDALQQRAAQVRTYGARHEQTCGYMAFGYVRSAGRAGVFAAVPGVRPQNLVRIISNEIGVGQAGAEPAVRRVGRETTRHGCVLSNGRQRRAYPVGLCRGDALT